MINQDKPVVGTPDTFLEVGSTFNLLIGGGYKLIVGVGNAITGIINSDKVSSSMANTAKGIIEPLWSASILPWQLSLPWLANESGINNQSKP